MRLMLDFVNIFICLCSIVDDLTPVFPMLANLLLRWHICLSSRNGVEATDLKYDRLVTKKEAKFSKRRKTLKLITAINSMAIYTMTRNYIFVIKY